METRAARMSLGLWTLAVVLFLWIPLVLICVYAFNSSNIQSWPIAGFSTKWFGTAWHNEDARNALVLSLKAAGFATAIALLLGTAAATAVSRFRFFGRDAITFLLVLPIALPGVVTGIATHPGTATPPARPEASPERDEVSWTRPRPRLVRQGGKGTLVLPLACGSVRQLLEAMAYELDALSPVLSTTEGFEGPVVFRIDAKRLTLDRPGRAAIEDFVDRVNEATRRARLKGPKGHSVTLVAELV